MVLLHYTQESGHRHRESLLNVFNLELVDRNIMCFVGFGRGVYNIVSEPFVFDGNHHQIAPPSHKDK